jgi:hypothetical protein
VNLGVDGQTQMRRALAGASVLAVLGLAVAACTTTTSPSKSASAKATSSPPASSAPASSPPASSPAVAKGKVIVSGSYAREAGETPGELYARLAGSSAYPNVSGWSEHDQEGGFRELDVFLRNASGLAGQQVTVFVGGQQVGAMTVSGDGQAFGEWDTEHGRKVPPATAGTPVQVKTG